MDQTTDELARRLCAATIAAQLGIRMDYAMKRYVEPLPAVDQVYHDAASTIQRTLGDRIARLLAGG